jgi:hypothetical protein
VTIQPIIAEHSEHGEAMFLGNGFSESYIKQQVDAIWAQSGVDITWLAPTTYANDFAYDGSPANYSSSTRPRSHLTTIKNAAGAPPKSPDSTVINMFFVEIVPGFEGLGDNYANGLATLDGNGICMHVGRNLVNWSGGRDVIASVMAHEIGHNLGLSHFSGRSNLMASGDPDSYLIQSQTDIVFTDSPWTDGYDFLKAADTPSNYELWVEANDVFGLPEDDDDKDGLTNLVEFALGFDPQSANGLPTPVWSAAGLTWTLPKNSEAVEDGIEMIVQTSLDCTGWSPAGTDSSSSVLTNSSAELSVRLNADHAASFMRLRVDSPETLLGNALEVHPEDLLDVGGEPAISNCSHGGCGCKHLPTPLPTP